MNIRTLRKNLPKNVQATREDKRTIRVQGGGLVYRVDNSAGTEEEAAAFLRSKMPIATLMPSR